MFKAAKTVTRLEARVEELKISISEVKKSRDSYKDRAHTAEEAYRQSVRKMETDPIRCAHFLDEALQTLPDELEKYRDSFRNVSSKIDILDDMIWSSTATGYYTAGLDATRIVVKACDEFLSKAPESILDLPCGHGRVMRWLKHVYPDSQLVGCDTQLHGMEFCEKHFASKSIPPAEKPSEMSTEQKVDVIWIGSLFTHLPEPEFCAFLAHLPNLLNDQGIVVFTTHGNVAIEKFRNGTDFHLHDFDADAVIKGYEDEGFSYSAYKRDPNYGVSFSSSSFLKSQIAKIPNLELRSLGKDLWSGLQDVCICQKV